ncbi:uncharacterized protein LOC129583459 [Paramacrobiotus metropolitanus]|uniref:uncharacterized protein LOC129583459 n=1 Tax=Paramacrobiotus metropolitanus TaxID=2943436 RepID=UPI0024463F27|nr:uncharacterized protein LOC129583459 [Paramacrobiotus metropolitanus]
MSLGHSTVVCVGLLLVSFYHSANAAGNKASNSGTTTGSGKCSQLPNVLSSTNTYKIKELMTSNPWYGYLTYNSDTRTAQDPSELNVVNYYISYWKSSEPTRSQPSELMYQQKRKYVNGSCAYLLEVAQFTTDGRQFGPYLQTNGSGQITDDGYDASFIWSTDQKTYIMFFWCAKHDWTSGNCASTHIYVYTKANPNDISKSQQDSINNAVNSVLKPYCLDTGKFAKYKWDKNLPECPPLPVSKRPDCFQHYENAFITLIEM